MPQSPRIPASLAKGSDVVTSAVPVACLILIRIERECAKCMLEVLGALMGILKPVSVCS